MTAPVWDVLVVGAGPAGMAAAIAAAEHGARVAVVDDNPSAGGQIWRRGITQPASADASKRMTAAAFAACGATLLSGYRVVDALRQGMLSCWSDEHQAFSTLLYDRLVLATGARERFLPFPGWTLPGVFGAGGLQALVRGGYDIRGKRVVVAGTGPLLLAVAAHLQEDGAKVVCIAEQASAWQMAPFAAGLWRSPTKLVQGVRLRMQLRRVPYRTGCWPTAAQGPDALAGVRLTDGQRTWTEPCELLACGFHLVPNTELASLLGCTLSRGCVAVDGLQRTAVPGVFCAGEPTGIAGLDAALLCGRIAGLAAAGDAKGARRLVPRGKRLRRFGEAMDRAFRLRNEVLHLATQDTIVCRCEDVRYGALKHLAQTGNGWTDAKLETRCGMGPCQGRICGPAVNALFGWTNSSIRPPIFPVPLAALCPEPPSETTNLALQETR